MSPEPVMPPWIVGELLPFTDEQLDSELEHAEKGHKRSILGRMADGELIGVDDPEPEHSPWLDWTPANDDEAEVAMARLGRARVLLADADAKKRQHEATIKAWYEAESKPLKRRVLRYTEALQAFAREYRRTTHRATMNLPSGVVVTEDRKPSVQLPNSDEGMAELVVWAKARSLPVVKVTEEVQIWKLRDFVKVAEIVTGQFASYGLSCGHSMETGVYDYYSNGPAPERMYLEAGEPVRCPRCSERVAVVDVEVFPISSLVAVGPDGLAVPGVLVDPGGIVAQTPKPGAMT